MDLHKLVSIIEWCSIKLKDRLQLTQDIYMMDRKRVTLRKAGENTGGIVIMVPDTMDKLLQRASDKLGIVAKHIFSMQGAAVCDIDVIRDDDILCASSEAKFSSVSPQHKASGLKSPLRNLASLSDKLLSVAGVGGDWVTLNVGGTYFTTTRSTLTTKEPESMLARMFTHSEDHVWRSSVDSNGAFLIDRSPVYFEPILNYLRNGKVIIDKNVNPQGVLEEARFFGIMSLAEQVEHQILAAKPVTDFTPITRRELVFKLMSTRTEEELRCQGVNFTGTNLSKLDLRHINFKYAILKGANLSGANLAYCNFERADLSHAKLDGANLLAIKMLCVTLEGASMCGCNFEDPGGMKANMEGANMKSVNLEGSHMSGVNLRVATLKNANLQNCDLRGAVLAGADLENCNLSGCDLQEANLRGANLKGAAFELMLNPLHMSQTVR